MDKPESHAGREPTVGRFFVVIWSDWGSRVSGALSVPFAFGAVYGPATWQKVLYGCLAVLAIVFTIYKVWAAERRTVIALQRELERVRALEIEPRLVGELNQAIIGETQDGSASVAYLNLIVVNRGAPTVITEWAVELVPADNTSVRGQLVLITDNDRLDFADYALAVTEDVAIYDKASSEPLVRGARIAGWLKIAFPGLRLVHAQTQNNRWRVAMTDAFGTPHVIDQAMGGRGEALKYVPGSGTIKILPK